jgi:hypothetical protein
MGGCGMTVEGLMSYTLVPNNQSPDWRPSPQQRHNPTREVCRSTPTHPENSAGELSAGIEPFLSVAAKDYNQALTAAARAATFP